LETPDRERLTLALRAVAKRDRGALESVYDQTSAKLFGLCLRILGDESEAEDVLQEVYVTIWKRAASFDASRGISPITWLTTIARNRAIDRLRASKAHLNRPLEVAAEAPDEAPLASERLLESDDRRRLMGCLEQLEPRQTACIRAAFFDGLTYPELAERAGTPLGTIKSWIRRGLIRLRTCMDHE
jgi:RNA polymerase sigma factor (sigma-70 family)